MPVASGIPIWSRGSIPSRSTRGSGAARGGPWCGAGRPAQTYIRRLAEKNLELLLRAWERLAPVRGSAQLVLVGRGPLEEPIRRSDFPAVHVPGLLHGAELSAAYASADIFTFPSPTETFGNSLLEAMGSGLPSLVAAAGKEFAAHGRNTWLVAPTSVTAVEEGLSACSRTRPSAAACRRRARTAGERSWDEVCDQR
jgi:glycosyltransferase involved in cell wall biosynthesis